MIVDEWISETQPHVSEDLLTNTEYTLRETVAPDGYTVTVDTSFTIDKNGKVTSTGTVNKDGVLLVEDSITHIKVSKVDAANGEELEGATIQILRKATEADTANEKTEYADEARTFLGRSARNRRPEDEYRIHAARDRGAGWVHDYNG